jgi:surface carbohydrate biosynthesis protein (TIGR04326 family)
MPQSKQEKRLLCIWDSEDAPVVDEPLLALWQSYSYAEKPAQTYISIPALVEERADELKARFLAWLYDLGELKLKNKRLVDHLALRENFSYWWMTLLVEKNYGKSRQLYKAVRLFALEELVRDLKPTEITFVSSDTEVAQCIGTLCTRLNLVFTWQKIVSGRFQRVAVKTYLFNKIPQIVFAAAYFVRKLGELKPLKRRSTSIKVQADSDFLFVDYLAHMDGERAKRGEYYSYYWTKLITLLMQYNKAVNWVHLYAKHKAVPSRKVANHLVDSFNEASNLHTHTCLGSYASMRLFYDTLSDYCVLIYRSFCLRKIKHGFSPRNSKLDFWPLFKSEWLRSMRGSLAIANCLSLNMFETFLKKLPHQKKAVYLQENLAWEKAFIYAWRAYGHGELIAVPHATVRYWDLRYFYDKRCYKRETINALPMPDCVAINSEVAKSSFLAWGYPRKQIISVEALRYLYLRNNFGQPLQKDVSRMQMKLLIFGDLLPQMNCKMIKCLLSASKVVGVDINYTLKSHPLLEINAEDYAPLELHVTTNSIEELCQTHDVVFTNINTSAAVEAYCAGLPVIQMLDGATFNASPLRGMPGVIYVKNVSEFVNALHRAYELGVSQTKDYFYLGNDLSRWRKLLKLHDESKECVHE